MALAYLYRLREDLARARAAGSSTTCQTSFAATLMRAARNSIVRALAFLPALFVSL